VPPADVGRVDIAYPEKVHIEGIVVRTDTTSPGKSLWTPKVVGLKPAPPMAVYVKSMRWVDGVE